MHCDGQPNDGYIDCDCAEPARAAARYCARHASRDGHINGVGRNDHPRAGVPADHRLVSLDPLAVGTRRQVPTPTADIVRYKRLARVRDQGVARNPGGALSHVRKTKPGAARRSRQPGGFDQGWHPVKYPPNPKVSRASGSPPAAVLARHREAAAMTPRAPSQKELRRGGAMWGAPPDAAPARPKMQLVSWKPVVRGSLRGFATVALPIGLKIHDVPVLVGKNGPWASLPCKPQIDRDGRQKTDANGKAAFATVLEWRTRQLSERFSEAVVALVRAAHSGDLDGVP
jgi:hypothetical protein